MFEPKSDSWPVRDSLQTAPAGSAPEALRVLLAEDTQISADVLLAMTRHLSVAMDHAVNGLEAIGMIAAADRAGQPYSLLLLDVNMPILDGVETARRLRAEGKTADDLPIIAITAATELQEVRAYRAAGMQAYLEKPVALDDLRATLRAWGHRTGSRPERKRNAAMAALKAKFEDRTIALIGLLDGTLAHDGAVDEALVMELRNQMHQLAGIAGTFGHPKLGDIARGQETALLAAFFAGEDVRPVLKAARDALGTEA